MTEGIVIIGCGAAGATAAMQARKFNRNIDITVIDAEPHSQYSRCGLPYTISGRVRDFRDLVLTPPENWSTLKIRALLGTWVTGIDSGSHILTVVGPGGEDRLEYGTIVFATGASNVDPPVIGLDKRRIYRLRTIDDAKSLAQEVGRARRMVVIGGGLIGMETAEALKERGIDVTVVEFLPNVLLAMVDPDVAEMIEKHCTEHGLHIMTNTAAMEVLGDAEPRSVLVKHRVTGETSEIPADAVVVATGVRPNVDLARSIGVNVGTTGGIVVDDMMRTNLDGVFACGDCAEHVDFVTRRPTVAGLGTVAVRQGRVAGINAAGGEARFPGIVGAKVTKLFGLEIGSTGLTEELGKKYGIDLVVGSVMGLTKPPYYIGGTKIRVKSYFSRESGKLVGGQVVGLEDAAMRLNVLTLGIQTGLRADGLFDFENCYAPAVCDTWDPLVTSADAARKRLRL